MEYDQRATMVSTGEHAFAVRMLAESYSAEDYLAAVTRARDVGAGEAYARAVLGDQDEVEVDNGQAVLDEAYRDLRARGVDPASCSQAELVAALSKVTS